MWFIGVEVEQETSAPPPKKILDPPLDIISVQELPDVKYSLLNEGLSISISKTKKAVFYYFLIIFCCT